MIILLQSVTIQFWKLFWHIWYYKMQQSNFLQSLTDCYYKVSQVLQSMIDFLPSASVITKWDSYYKVTVPVSDYEFKIRKWK